MLLQTFVQLHILLAATPALAGWILLVPPTQAQPAHIIYLAAANSPGAARAGFVSRRTCPVPHDSHGHMLSRASTTAVPVPCRSAASSVESALLQESVPLSSHSPRAP